jgi:hypothetical protein
VLIVLHIYAFFAILSLVIPFIRQYQFSLLSLFKIYCVLIIWHISFFISILYDRFGSLVCPVIFVQFFVQIQIIFVFYLFQLPCFTWVCYSRSYHGTVHFILQHIDIEGESIYLYFPPSSQLLYLWFCPGQNHRYNSWDDGGK